MKAEIMKYKDLIEFDPIESVVQLRDADMDATAEHLVSTYVISDKMAENLTQLVIPLLQFEEPVDNKGLFIVGNYGTGKSHLMSVISSIAADKHLIDFINNENVKNEGKKIAGKFQAIRTEIGASAMTLRNILISVIEEHLEKLGIQYRFPDQDSIVNHKTAFEDMMAMFNNVFPEQGLLLVVDELLDFLRSRNDKEIVQDLNFLREIGEICQNLRFRFIAGIQEAIFDSSRFSFVAESIRKVKDRFEQILIVRDDIMFVVSERLLKKTADQQAKIKTHLESFSKYYGRFNEEIDKYVQLFPVHPNYIDTFARITVAEKREILRTISRSMKEILEDKVPTDKPGLIAFDSYWSVLRQNPVFRAIPEIREVIECSEVLESRIENGMREEHFKSMAIQLVHALSVHRLTVGDIYSPIGATSEELRDRLCLYDQFVSVLESDNPDKDLLTHVDAVFESIIRTVSSQFISHNDNNNQYYLDLKKTEDFDALIEKRMEGLSESQLDRYFYEALKRVMECSDVTYVTGFNIWQRELLWKEHNTTRTGYLFFGAPNDRSTAVPNRDFYIYFVQPFDPYDKLDRSINENKSDEVFFHLDLTKDVNNEFQTTLKKYSAAQELAATSSGGPKNTYENKANEYLRMLVQWFQNNMLNSFEVTYQSQKKSMKEWASGKSIRELSGLEPNETLNFRDLIESISSICLAPNFEDQAPDYPVFSILVTGNNRKQAATDALRAISGQSRTKQATAVLDALELLNGEKFEPQNSRYTKFLLDLVSSKESSQVVTRDEIIEDHNGIEYMKPDSFRLEPEWVVVLIASLVYSGEIMLSILGKKFDATELRELADTEMSELIQFRNLELPKDLNLSAIRCLFELLGLASGEANLINQGQTVPIQNLQNKILEKLDELATVQHTLGNGPTFWGEELFEVKELEKLKFELDGVQAFFDSLQVYNSLGRMKSFQYGVSEIKKYEKIIVQLDRLKKLDTFIVALSSITIWLSTADGVLPPSHDWNNKLKQNRSEILNSLKQIDDIDMETFMQKTKTRLVKLKSEYILAYFELHSKNRLNVSDEAHMEQLKSDRRLQSLNELSNVEILPNKQLNDFHNKFSDLEYCSNLVERDLENKPTCPHCGYNPSVEINEISIAQKISHFEIELEELIDKWTAILVENLENPVNLEHMELLDNESRKILNDFKKSKIIPVTVESKFVSSLNTVFSDLVKITVCTSELHNALKIAEGPVTPEKIKNRFNEFINKITEGTAPEIARIVIESSPTDRNSK